MLQEVTADSKISLGCKRFIEDLQECGFQGDISTNLARRVVSSTDNSIWQELPEIIITPHSHDCVVQLLTILDRTSHQEISVTARGGGTSTAGQSLTHSVVLDCKQHLHSILDYNEHAKQVHVECGAVLSEVNEALLEFGVKIGPTVATATRATIGGMIGNDSAGKGSSVYGKMSDCVVDMQTVLRGGTLIENHPEIITTVKNACDMARPYFEKYWPTLPRFATGYNLPMTWDGNTFDLNRLICGSEGTLGITTSAVLQCVQIPKKQELVLLSFDSFDEALHCGSQLRQFNPSAVECVDEMVIQAAIDNDSFDLLAASLGAIRDDIRAILLVEFTDENTRLSKQAIEYVETSYSILNASHLIEQEQIQNAWSFRSRSVGLLSSLQGEKTPIPFVEDCAVPPEQLSPFITDFKKLLDTNGLQAGMFGHVDAGVIHVRPALNMELPSDRDVVQTVTEQVAALVQSYGGILWGEHGKGFRSEFGPSVFGEVIWEQMCTIKHAFDPKNQLNPCKVAPPKVGGALYSTRFNTKGESNASIAPLPILSNAIRCDGNSECESASFTDAMCPTYRATGNPIHSPRGRANLLRHWLQHVGESPATKKGSFINRVAHSANQTDYSHDVRRALDGCLSCMACASECPLEIDIPSMRAEFYNAYFGRYLRPIRDFVWFNMERMLPILTSPIGKIVPSSLLASMVGIVDSPKVQRKTTWSVPICSPSEILEKNPSLVLLQDSFTTFFRPQALKACIEIATSLGHNVVLLEYKPSGKAFHIRGNLKAFNKIAHQNFRWLKPVMNAGIPIVGIEPATTLLWRNEYPRSIGKRIKLPVMLPQEWLIHENLSTIKIQGNWRLFPHCIEKASSKEHQLLWQQLFSNLGANLEIIKTACCGMGGLFGHEREHQQQSHTIWEQHWAPHEPVEQNALVTGYSCYSQAIRFEQQKLLHPLELITNSIPCQ